MGKWIGALMMVVLFVGFGVRGIPGVHAQDAAAVPAPAAGAATLSKAVMETERFMKMFSDPLADKLKEAMALEPASPRDWRKVEDLAQSGAEIANLILIREGDEPEKTPEWKDMTKGMFEASVAMAEAAGRKDYAGTKAKYLGLVQACNTCHQKIDPDTLPVIEP